MPSETTRLIGRRCTGSDAFSRAILIARMVFILVYNLLIPHGMADCKGLRLIVFFSYDSGLQTRVRAVILVSISRGVHPFSSRTRKLSHVELMVLHRACGRVGRRQDHRSNQINPPQGGFIFDFRENFPIIIPLLQFCDSCQKYHRLVLRKHSI